MYYYIVEFTNTADVAVIPSNWLEGEDKCYWPPKKFSSSIPKFAEKRYVPQADWLIFDVRVFASFSTYAQARQKLGRFEYTSDLTTDEEGPRKKRPNTRYESESLESADQHIPPAPAMKKAGTSPVPPISLSDSFSQFLQEGLDSPPVPPSQSPSLISAQHHYQYYSPHQTRVQQPQPLNTPDTHHQHYITTNQTHSTLQTLNKPHSLLPPAHTAQHLPQACPPTAYSSQPGPSSAPHCSCTCPKHTYDTKLLKEIEKHLRESTKAFLSLKAVVDGLAAGTPLTPVSLPPALPSTFPVSLPVQSMEDLERLEDHLSTDVNLSSATSFLGATGGRDVKHIIGNILKVLLVNDLARSFNWKGRGEKKPFSGFKRIILLVFNAAKRHSLCGDITLLQAEDIIKTWLRFAADREGGRCQRREKNN